MFLVVFGDIYIDNLQNIFLYAIMDTLKSNEKIFVKQQKYYLENISTNLHFWLGAYKIPNKQLVEIKGLLKFVILSHCINLNNINGVK